MKAKETRKVRGYKIKDSVYFKAQKKASKGETQLATLIEAWVTNYGKYGSPLISTHNYNPNAII